MSLRKRFKKIGRKVIATHEKYVSRYARPAVAAAASYAFGPVVGAAFTAATHPLHQYAATVGARDRGLQGLEARQKGRAQAKRTTIYSAVGVTAGTLTAVGAGALGLAGQGAGSNALAGTVGSNALWGGASPAAANTGFITSYSQLAAQPAGGGVPGIVTSLGGAAAPAAGGGGLTTALIGAAVTGATSALSSKTSSGGHPTTEAGGWFPGSTLGGGGGGADSPGDPIGNVLDALRGGIHDAGQEKSDTPWPLIAAGGLVALGLVLTA